MTVQPDAPPRYNLEDRSEADHEYWFFDVSDDPKLQIRYDTWKEDGRIADFCIRLILADGDASLLAEGESAAEEGYAEGDAIRGVDLMRVDCAHDCVHVHRFEPKGQGTFKVIQQIYTQEDVKTGWDQTDGLIESEWEVALTRWNRGT